jgi:hypothetical protein
VFLACREDFNPGFYTPHASREETYLTNSASTRYAMLHPYATKLECRQGFDFSSLICPTFYLK